MDPVLVESNTLRKVFRLTIDGNAAATPHQEIHLAGVAQACATFPLISSWGILPCFLSQRKHLEAGKALATYPSSSCRDTSDLFHA